MPSVCDTTGNKEIMLCSVEDLKDYLGLEVIDEAKAERYIKISSELIENYLDRKLGYVEDHVEYVQGFGQNSLILSRYPISNLKSIELEDNCCESMCSCCCDDKYLVDSGAGVVNSCCQFSWTAQKRITSSNRRKQAGAECYSYKVTYSGGYCLADGGDPEDDSICTLPWPIKDAVMAGAAELYNGKVSNCGDIKSKKIGSVSVSYFSPSELNNTGRPVIRGLSVSHLDILDRYKRYYSDRA